MNCRRKANKVQSCYAIFKVLKCGGEVERNEGVGAVERWLAKDVGIDARKYTWCNQLLQVFGLEQS